MIKTLFITGTITANNERIALMAPEIKLDSRLKDPIKMADDRTQKQLKWNNEAATAVYTADLSAISVYDKQVGKVETYDNAGIIDFWAKTFDPVAKDPSGYHVINIIGFKPRDLVQFIDTASFLAGDPLPYSIQHGSPAFTYHDVCVRLNPSQSISTLASVLELYAARDAVKNNDTTLKELLAKWKAPHADSVLDMRLLLELSRIAGLL